MKPGILPDILQIAPIRRISPSRFISLKECALKEVWTAARQPMLLPQSPAARVGAVIHRLLEEAGKGFFANATMSVQSRWEELIQDTETEMRESWLDRFLIPLRRTVADYEVRRIRACRKASEVAQDSSGTYESTSHTQRILYEAWVASSGGLIGGFIDQVREAKDSVVLRDYKSGHILDKQQNDQAPGIKEAYQIQLRIYAALYRSTYGRWPTRLVLVPLQGAEQEVPFRPSDCEELVQEAVQRLKEVNAIIDQLTVALAAADPADLLARPTASACRYCLFRPCCSAYHKTRPIRDDSTWPHDVWGTLIEVRQLANGRLTLSLRSENRGPAVIHVRGLDPSVERHPALDFIHEGDPIAVYSLNSTGSPEVFSEASQTVLYGNRKAIDAL
jgi:RecB family exonuclease